MDVALALVNSSALLFDLYVHRKDSERQKEVHTSLANLCTVTLKYLDSMPLKEENLTSATFGRVVKSLWLETLLSRHLCTMGRFYASNNKLLTAEGLYRQAVDLLMKQPNLNAYEDMLVAQIK